MVVDPAGQSFPGRDATRAAVIRLIYGVRSGPGATPGGDDRPEGCPPGGGQDDAAPREDGSGPDADPNLSADQLEELVVAHGELVYRLAAAIVHDHDLAQDITQDVLFKAWQALPDHAAGLPIPWLRVVTRNAAIDTLRRRSHDVVTEAPPEPGIPPWQPDHLVEARLHLDAMWGALGHLAPEARSMIVLRETEAMSYEEIAATFELTVSAVKAKLYRARHQLRQALSEWTP